MLNRLFTTPSLLLLLCSAALISPLTRPVYAAETAVNNGSGGKPDVKADVKAWKKNRAAGKKACEEGKAPEAETFFRAALNEAENFAANDRRQADSLEDLGDFYEATGNVGAAEPLLRRAAVIRRGDPDFLLEATCLMNLGAACQGLAKYDDAEKFLLQAQEVVARSQGASHPRVALCMFYRACLYYEEEKYSLAEPLFKQCLPRFQNPGMKSIYHPFDPVLAGVRIVPEYSGNAYNPVRSNVITFLPNYAFALDTLTHLGLLCFAQKRFDEAQAYFQQSLQEVEAQVRKNPVLLQSTVQNLVVLHLARKDYAGADAVLQQALKFQVRSLGAKHITTLQTQAELAAVYEQEQKMTEAEALYQKTVATEDKVFGPNSDESAETLRSLAKFYLARGRYEEAEPLYRRLAVRTEKFQGMGIALSPILSGQAIIYSKLGRDAELEAVYKRQIAIYENMFGAQHKAVAKSLEEYASFLRKQKREAEAEPLEARVKSIRGAGAK